MFENWGPKTKMWFCIGQKLWFKMWVLDKYGPYGRSMLKEREGN
jgi:hypothetical protein